MKKREIISTALDANPTSDNFYEILLDEQICKILAQNKDFISDDKIVSALKDQNIIVSKDELQSAINRLRHKQYVPSNCKWTKIQLAERIKLEVLNSCKKYEDTISEVIDNYFSVGINVEKCIIQNWLQDLLLLVFQKYYVNVLSHIVNQSSQVVDFLEIEVLHKELAARHKLDNDNSQILLSQFKLMMSSQSDAKVVYLCHYFLNSCHASQILTSKTYTSVSVADMFKNKTVILDTNVLIALQLEKQTKAHVNLDVIDDICKKLNVKLKCLQQTIDEYTRVISYKSKQYSEIISLYSKRVVDSAKYDNILYALRLNGCDNLESITQFFNKHLLAPPTSLGDSFICIERIRYDESYSVFEFYKSNELDKENLRNVFTPIDTDGFDDDDTLAQGKEIKKREGVVEHDLGLIGYVRTLRGQGEFSKKRKILQNDDTIILTMDSSLVTYASSQYPNEKFVYNIRDIITMLALNRGGLLGDKADFTPMLSKFVNNNFIIWEDTFDIKDLTIAMNLERQVASLNDTKALQIIRELHKMKCANKHRNEIHRFLQKELNFEYNKVTSENIQLIDKNNEQAEQIKEDKREIEKLREENIKYRKQEFEDKYKKEVRKRKCCKFKKIVLLIIGIILFSICIFLFVLNFFSADNWVINLAKKYDWFYWLVEISKTKCDEVFTLISLVFTICNFRKYLQLKEAGHFDKNAIIRKILDEMNLEKEVENYILSGEIDYKN